MRVGIDAHMIGDHSGGNESFYTNIINNMNPPKNMEIILFVKKGADLSALTNKFKRIEFQESSALKRKIFYIPSTLFHLTDRVPLCVLFTIFALNITVIFLQKKNITLRNY